MTRSMAKVIKAGDVTYGVMAVPDGQDIAIFKHDGDKWWGVGSADHIAGTSALVGNPNPDTAATLDEALHNPNSDHSLRNWLMNLVGAASTLDSAKRTVERCVQDAIERNRQESPDMESPQKGTHCQCWNEGQYGRVHREDCPIHTHLD